MKTAVVAVVVSLAAFAAARAQETKPVPKGSARVVIPGCSKGYIFTAGPRSEEHPGSVDVPVGMHMRMNGPKALISEIKAHEGSMIELTGLMKKGQYNPGGIGIGGGVRVGPGQAPVAGGGGSPVAGQIFIDVEGWRPVVGDCPSR
jgi:hypothetical protein